MPRLKREREFYFTGNVKLNGVTIVVLARDEVEARDKAEQGQWEDAEYNTAERSDFHITRMTGRE